MTYKVVNLQQDHPSFSWGNGLYMLVERKTQEKLVHLCKIDDNGQPELNDDGTLQITCTGEDNIHETNFTVEFKQPELRIDRVLEIDMDTDRIGEEVIVRIRKRSDARGDVEIPHELSREDDAVVMMNALLACIIDMEKSDKYKVGEAFGKMMDKLYQGYFNTDPDECFVTLNDKIVNESNTPITLKAN